MGAPLNDTPTEAPAVTAEPAVETEIVVETTEAA